MGWSFKVGMTKVSANRGLSPAGFRYDSNSLTETDRLSLHDEGEDISPGVTAKTVELTELCIDEEAFRSAYVERAHADVVFRRCLHETDILSDDTNDI
jgi:hypothetical protein